MNNEDQDNDRIEDSLDNLSNIKLRQSSLQKHRVELIQVKQKFIGFLEKLQTSQTREISLSEIKKLIEKNNESDHLRIYLSILKSLKPNHNSTTKQHQVLVISIIAKVFRSNLIDPVDKQPSLIKTCFKIVEILMAFFNDTSNTVQQACARVLLDLNEFCLQQGKFPYYLLLYYVHFSYIKAILRNGVDKASQATATVCINQLLKFWYGKSQKQYLDIVSKDIFSVILKINSEYHEIFMAAIILIEHKGLLFFENKIPNFLSKILPIIDGTREGTNSFNAYMCKVNVCKIIQKVALLLKPDERQKLVDLNIVGSLSKAARNKIIQVQMAATRALKVWRGEAVSQQKLQRPSTSKGKGGLKSLQQMRDQKKRQRSNSKQNTIKIQNELNYMKEDLQKMVKGGWGANNRAKNYVKRGSGVGGGHYGQFEGSATPPKSTKSHREHLEELRSMIKQGSKQNKNVDKFDYLQEQQKRDYQQKHAPTSSNNSVNVFVSRKNSNPNTNTNGQERQVEKRHSNNNSDRIVQNNKKNSGRKDDRIKQVNNNSNDDDDFRQEQDGGDQAVYMPVKKQGIKRKNSNGSNGSNNKNNNKYQLQQLQRQAQNLQVGDQQANSLLRQQQQQQRNNNTKNNNNSNNKNDNKNNNNNNNLQLNFKTNNQQQHPIQKAQTTNNNLPPHSKVIKDEKFLTKASKLKQNLAMLGSMISQRELQQLMMQNNLSDVSENLSNCLNQSDMNLNQYEQQGTLRQLEESKKLSPQRVLRDNFMKKTNNNNVNINPNSNSKRQHPYNESLNYTQSRVSNFKQSINQGNNNNTNSNDKSLTNTLQKPSQSIRQQFTLNPNQQQQQQQSNQSKQGSSTDKFQSLRRQNNNEDQQIQQDIVQSYFQQSKPKQQHMLPIRTKLSPKSNFSPKKQIINNKNTSNKNNNKLSKQQNNKHRQQHQQQYNKHRQQHQQQQQQQQESTNNNNYQQLIQHPPTNYQTQNYIDKKSFINNNQQTKQQSTLNNNKNQLQQRYQQPQNQQQEQQQKQTVTDKWIRILSLVQNNDINSAYEQAFLLDDPIYLIRLLIMTRTPISSLTAHNCSELWEKFIDIYQHNFISILFVQLFTQADDLQLIKNSLTIEDMNDLLLKLYQVSGTSKGKLSFNAALLYNKVDQSLRPNKK